MVEIAYEAPAKVNLSLLVGAPDRNGYHPLYSIVQTIEWTDRLEMGRAGEDHLEVRGAVLGDGGDNLVWKGLDALPGARPHFEVVLEKRVAVAAGLGGGSSDAAAAMAAASELLGLPRSVARQAAPRVGADVTFLLGGGSAVMEGYGEKISRTGPFDDFVVAVVVPPFEMSTPEVYGRWDRLDRPVGKVHPPRWLPPSLRGGEPIRNDLTAAATSLRPELADWIHDLGGAWERPVALSGSGPTLFGFFGDLDEAESAVEGAPPAARSAMAVPLRPHGVSRVDG